MKIAILPAAGVLLSVLLWTACEKPKDQNTLNDPTSEEQRIQAERERKKLEAIAKREADARSMAEATKNLVQSVRPHELTAGDSKSAASDKASSEAATKEWAEKFRDLAISDPNSALKALASEVPPSLRSAVAEALLADIGRVNLDAIPILLNAVTDVNTRAMLLSQVTFAWGEREPRRLFDLALRELKGKERNLVLVNAIRGTTASHDFQMGKQLLAEMPFSNERLDVLGDLAWAYGNSNLDEALDWAKQLEVSEDRDRAMGSLTKHIAQSKGLEGIEQALEVVKNGSTRIQYMNAAASLLHKEGTQAINQWLQRFSAQEQDRMIEHIMRTAPLDSLVEMSNYVSTMPTKHGQQVAAAELAGRLVQSSPEAAADWVLKLPGEYRRAGIMGLVNTWYGTDSDQLGAWISQLPRGNDRDTALEQLAGRVKQSDPDSARTLAAQISDEKKRKSVEANLKR